MGINHKIVFFGTGPVAATSLESLAGNFTVECVITKQAQAHYRGPVPVVKLATRLGLPVEFANTKGELDILIRQKPSKSQLGVIVDHGVIVSSEVIATFKFGIINSHFSLLPQWRGADPISYTILSGQAETGVSLMKIVEALDAGQLIAQEKIPVRPDITTPELTKELVQKSNEMLSRYLPEYLSGKLEPYDQPDLPATYSRKLTKADGILDWTKPAIQLEREIRAYIEWPRSRMVIAGKDIVVTKAHVVNRREDRGERTEEKTGAVIVTHEKELAVQTGDGILVIDSLKPAGKPEMSAGAFLAGYKDLLQ